MNVQASIGLLACLSFAACQVGPQDSAAQPNRRGSLKNPNIVLIMADDMGYGDAHCLNPMSTLRTPNLDRLAREGMSFTDAHTPSAVCTPTRYGLLTGRYCWRTRLKRGVLNGYSPPLLDSKRRTIGHLMQAAGYHTGIVGKWHLGLGWTRVDQRIDFTAVVTGVPNRNGFDSSYIIPASLDFPPYVYIRDGRVTEPAMVLQAKQSFPAYLRRGPRSKALIMEEALDHLTERAVEYIGQHKHGDQPFLLYFPLTAPHKPAWPHRRFRGKSGLGDYGDFVTQVDWTVGQVLSALESAGIVEDTLVIYTSDNGSYMHRYEQADQPDHVDDAKIPGYRPEHHRANGELRGTKADIWEAGHRVPFFVRWPGKVAAGVRCPETICLTDVLATLAELVGSSLDREVGEDSFSFLPLLRGLTKTSARPPVVHHSAGGMFAIRDGKWKLVAGNGSGGRQRPRGQPFGQPFQLFDLSSDLGEAQNLLGDHPEVAKRLLATLTRFRESGRSVTR